jgi:hypothetical protein
MGSLEKGVKVDIVVVVMVYLMVVLSGVLVVMVPGENPDKYCKMVWKVKCWLEGRGGAKSPF